MSSTRVVHEDVTVTAPAQKAERQLVLKLSSERSARPRSAGRGRGYAPSPEPMNLQDIGGPMADLKLDATASTSSSHKDVQPLIPPINVKIFVPMPGKTVERDEDRIEPVQFFDVRSNMFVLDMKNAVKEVCKYELAIVSIGKGREKDLCKFPPNDFLANSRRRLLWSLWTHFITANKLAEYYEVHYDRRTIAYAIRPLFDHRVEQITRTMPTNSLPTEIRSQLPPSAEQVIVNCKFVETVSLSLFDGCFDNDDLEARNRPLIQFLEIATSQEMHRRKAHLVFNNAAYVPEGKDMPRRIRRLHHGFVKNVRPVGNSRESAQIIVQIDSTRKPLYMNISVLDFIGRLLNINGSGRVDYGQLLYNKICRSGPNRKDVYRQLKDVAVTTTYGKRRTFVINGLSDASASQMMFKDANGMEVTVPQYYESTHCIRLKYPVLPCAVEKKPGSKEVSYYPLELLTIENHQRAERDILMPDEESSIVLESAVLPEERLRLIRMHIGGAHLTDDNPYLKALGIRIAVEPLVGKNAFQLHAPAIAYRNNRMVNPVDGSWKLDQNGFVRPANAPKKWAAVILEYKDPNLEHLAENFVNCFINGAKRRGLFLTSPYRQSCEPTEEPAHNMMKLFANDGCEFVLFFTREKFAPIHDTMKVFEQKYALITQHVCRITMEKAVKTQMVMDNILMKTNQKLGGLNNLVTTSNAFNTVNPQLAQIRDIISSKWLAKDRLFVGMDVAHPKPLSAFERRLGIPQDPSAVGLCYSKGQESPDFVGDFWYQASKREKVVEGLDGHIATAVERFKDNWGAFPNHIVFYRDGVSEGQYRMVIDEEVPQIRAGCIKAAGSADYKPKLTLMVLQKRGNQRVMPMPGNLRPGAVRAAELNVPPGTCIEAGLVHPVYLEFIIVPHKTIQGSARPVRCTLLVDDEPRLGLDELEGMTHALCYAHEIVNGAVSLPEPAYAAHELAKRAMNNYREFKRLDLGSIDGSSAMSGALNFDPTEVKGLTARDFGNKFWA